MHDSAVPRHVLSSDHRPRMAKAEIRKPEIEEWRLKIGRAIERTRMLCELSLKEFADYIGRDERQVARWIAGTERAHWDAILAVARVGPTFAIEIAALVHDVEVITEVRIRRRDVA